jgi:hypothetical protein
MVARRFIPRNRFFFNPEYDEPMQFRRISKCFIRKGHTCGKYLGVSTSCFIACPSTDSVKMLTDLISEKLRRNGIDPVVAIDIRAYGQDIFCTKICGKIIEAQFCIAILDDISESVHGKDMNIPNPNVYYEYGLMTALDKYVIPLQKEGQDLAFSIKTHDTIRYSPGDVSAEIEKALKEAIRITVEERELSLEVIPVHMYRSFLAINGYQTTSYSWFLRDDLEGTVFQGYKNDKRSEYLFFTVIDDKDMLKTCLMDIRVIKRRLNDRFENLVGQIESFNQAISKQEEEIRKEKSEETTEKRSRVPVLYFDRQRELNDSLEKKQEASDRVALIKNSKFGIILNPDLVEFKEKCVIELRSIEADVLRLPVYFGDISGIQIGDVEIKFKAPEL